MSVDSPQEAPAAAPRPSGWLDALAAGIFALLASYFLYLSWRKWPDPLIDVGAQLYVPWRLSEGAVLFRDVESLYGPLSHYWNSVVFRIAGASLNAFVASNLAVYAAIVALLYLLVRAGWGRLAAGVGTSVFIAVFSFTRLGFYGGYNYVAPYSQEATHGMLELLALAWVARGWLARPAPWRIFLAGLLCGLTVLTKPEYMLAAGAMMAAAFFIWARAAWQKPGPADAPRTLGCFLAGGLLPPLLATGLFSLADRVEFGTAWRYANNAWIMVLENTDLVGAQTSISWMGLDDPSGNLTRLALWGGAGVGVVVGMGWLSRWFRAPREGRRLGGKPHHLIAGAVAVFAAGLFFVIPAGWRNATAENIANVFPAVLLLAVVAEFLMPGRREWSGPEREAGHARLILWLAAVAMLFRMILSPRVHHYGFTQAALAGVVVVATVVAAVPLLLRLAPPSRVIYQAGTVALVLAVCARIAAASELVHRAVVFPIAAGTPDAFLSLAPVVNPTGKLVESARAFLETDKTARSLLVLPEGAMLNYLARIPSTISQYVVFVPAAGAQRMKRAARELQASPPDRIALISRSLEEYGVKGFGESEAHGAAFIRFLLENYDPNPVFRAVETNHDGRRYSVVIWARRDSP